MSIFPQIRNVFALTRVAQRAPSIQPVVPPRSLRASLITYRRLLNKPRPFSSSSRSTNASPPPRRARNFKETLDKGIAQQEQGVQKTDENIRKQNAQHYRFMRKSGSSKTRARRYIVVRTKAAGILAAATVIGISWAALAVLRSILSAPLERKTERNKRDEVSVEVTGIDPSGGGNMR